jgi:hypothetical protein
LLERRQRLSDRAGIIVAGGAAQAGDIDEIARQQIPLFQDFETRAMAARIAPPLSAASPERERTVSKQVHQKRARPCE